MENNLAILVLSCDKYEFLWDIFFESLQKNLRINSKVYLATNFKKYSKHNVVTVNSGKNTDWSDELLTVLEKIPEENVFIMLEDAPLIKEVDLHKFNNLNKIFISNGWSYLGLKGTPRSRSLKNFKNIGIVEKGDFYRASLIFAIWKKSILKNIIVKGESAWQFEVNGSIRSDRHDGFYCTKKSIIDFDHLLIKGEFNWLLQKKYKDMISVNNLSVMSFTSWLKLKSNEISVNLATFILPNRFHRKAREVKNKLSKIFK